MTEGEDKPFIGYGLLHDIKFAERSHAEEAILRLKKEIEDLREWLKAHPQLDDMDRANIKFRATQIVEAAKRLMGDSIPKMSDIFNDLLEGPRGYEQKRRKNERQLRKSERDLKTVQKVSEKFGDLDAFLEKMLEHFKPTGKAN